MMLIKRGQTQKATYFTILFVKNIQDRSVQSMEGRWWLPRAVVGVGWGREA